MVSRKLMEGVQHRLVACPHLNAPAALYGPLRFLFSLLALNEVIGSFQQSLFAAQQAVDAVLRLSPVASDQGDGFRAKRYGAAVAQLPDGSQLREIGKGVYFFRLVTKTTKSSSDWRAGDMGMTLSSSKASLR